MLARIHEEMLDSMEHLDRATQGAILLSYIEYQIKGIEPDNSDPIVYAYFKAKQFDLDSMRNDVKASVSNGAKGGRPVKTWDNSQKPKITYANLTEPNVTGERNRERDMKQENENKKIIQEPIMCNGTLHTSPSFEQFWDLYPNKKDKKKARDKFSRLSSDKKQQAIDGISRLRKSDQWRKGFIPLPTTYLNGERWEDEIDSRSSRLNQIQEYQHQARLEEAREILHRDSDENVQSKTFDRRAETGCT